MVTTTYPTTQLMQLRQTEFISAFNNLERYRGDSTFGAWLKRIVINKAIKNGLAGTRRTPETLVFFQLVF